MTAAIPASGFGTDLAKFYAGMQEHPTLVSADSYSNSQLFECVLGGSWVRPQEFRELRSHGPVYGMGFFISAKQAVCVTVDDSTGESEPRFKTPQVKPVQPTIWANIGNVERGVYCGFEVAASPLILRALDLAFMVDHDHRCTQVCQLA